MLFFNLVFLSHFCESKSEFNSRENQPVREKSVMHVHQHMGSLIQRSMQENMRNLKMSQLARPTNHKNQSPRKNLQVIGAATNGKTRGKLTVTGNGNKGGFTVIPLNVKRQKTETKFPVEIETRGRNGINNKWKIDKAESKTLPPATRRLIRRLKMTAERNKLLMHQNDKSYVKQFLGRAVGGEHNPAKRGVLQGLLNIGVRKWTGNKPKNVFASKRRYF